MLHFWNVSVLQRVHLPSLVALCLPSLQCCYAAQSSLTSIGSRLSPQVTLLMFHPLPNCLKLVSVPAGSLNGWYHLYRHSKVKKRLQSRSFSTQLLTWNVILITVKNYVLRTYIFLQSIMQLNTYQMFTSYYYKYRTDRDSMSVIKSKAYFLLSIAVVIFS
jgi:hypothetical protein